MTTVCFKQKKTGKTFENKVIMDDANRFYEFY